MIGKRRGASLRFLQGHGTVDRSNRRADTLACAGTDAAVRRPSGRVCTVYGPVPAINGLNGLSAFSC